MSSHYTTVNIEALQRARIEAELLEQIEKLRVQLRETHQNDVAVSAATIIEINASMDEECDVDYTSNVRIAERITPKQAQSPRVVVELSSLLQEKHGFPTLAEQEIQQLVDSIEHRAVLTEQDEQERERLLSEVAKAMCDTTMDVEDKRQHLEMRIEAYLQRGTPRSCVDFQKLEDKYCQYCALCQLVGADPRETLPERVAGATKELLHLAKKQQQDAYIMNTLEEIMTSLGCSVVDRAVLGNAGGQLFSVDGYPLCNVFVGADDSGIMFEPVAQTTGGSLDQRRRLEAGAEHVCSLYDKMEELALERGILVQNRVYAEPASVDAMCVQSELRISTKSKQQRRTKTATLKARTTEDEG